jgi:hypothetical protein
MTHREADPAIALLVAIVGVAGVLTIAWPHLFPDDPVAAAVPPPRPVLIHGCKSWRPANRMLGDKYLWAGTGCTKGDPQFLPLPYGKEP